METIQARRQDKKLRKIHEDPIMRMHLWFETEDGVVFGLGRLLLLQKVEQCGSLKAAAEELGMSYRGAWGKLRKTEELLGRDLVDKGGCRRSGVRLTPYGRDLARLFSYWYREVEQYALCTSAEFLPFHPAAFKSELPVNLLQPVKNNQLK